MKGQDILLDEFGTGAFSFVVVEGMDDKDLQKIADEIKDVPHVKNVIWYGSVMDFSIPREALPDDIYNFFNSNFYWDQITDKSSGIGQPNVNGTSLKELILPLAPLNEQKRIAIKIKSIFSQLDTMQEIFLQ